MSTRLNHGPPRVVRFEALFRRLTTAVHDGLALLFEAIAILPIPSRIVDGLDEQLARGRRVSFGRRACVLSWQRESGGSWKARLSGPELDRTVERSSRTRARAILRSARAMRRILEFQASHKTHCPGADPDSTHATAP